MMNNAFWKDLKDNLEDEVFRNEYFKSFYNSAFDEGYTAGFNDGYEASLGLDA